MGFELAGGGELTELMTNHVFRHVNLDMSFSVMDSERMADKVRRNGAPAGPGLNDLLLTGSFHHLYLLQNFWVNVDSFFKTSTHSLG